MDLKIRKIIRQGELIQRLRTVTMLENRDIRPYENAEINIFQIDPKQIWPTQNYVLRKNLKRLQELRWDLLEQDYALDILQLSEGCGIEFEVNNEIITIIPPIIEVEPSMDSMDEGEMGLICDGMHRIYMAYMEWISPICIVIEDASVPYYAHPRRRGWKGIDEIDSIPENYIKKWHRFKDNKRYYRDFNSAFTNIGGPRGNLKEDKTTGDIISITKEVGSLHERREGYAKMR